MSIMTAALIAFARGLSRNQHASALLCRGDGATVGDGYAVLGSRTLRTSAPGLEAQRRFSEQLSLPRETFVH